MTSAYGDMWTKDEAYLIRRMEALETFVKQSFAAGTLNASEINSGGTLKIDGSLNVTGTETVGGTLNVTGNTVIGGTLSLPNGIINNDALVTPLVPAAPHADSQSFSISTSLVVKATATITVPAGFSRALVIAVAQGSGFNGANTNQDTLSVAVRINGTVPPGWSASCGSSNQSQAAATAAGSALLTGLGGSFTIACAMGTQLYTWPSTVWNTANIDATVLFLR